jgi:hypothetical protein
MQEIIFPTSGSKASQKRKMIIDGRCDILTAMTKKPATMIVTNIELIIIYDLAKPCNEDGLEADTKDDVMLFQWTAPSDKLLHKAIPLSSIKEIQRRRFLGHKSALELFMIDNQQVLVNFENTDIRNEFAKKIIR